MIDIAATTMSLMSGHTSCMSCWIAGITDANVAPMLPMASMTDAFTLSITGATTAITCSTTGAIYVL